MQCFLQRLGKEHGALKRTLFTDIGSGSSLPNPCLGLGDKQADFFVGGVFQNKSCRWSLEVWLGPETSFPVCTT